MDCDRRKEQVGEKEEKGEERERGNTMLKRRTTAVTNSGLQPEGRGVER